MNKGSRWKYFFKCLLLVATGLALGGMLFHRRLEHNLEDLLEEENVRAARLVSFILRQEGDPGAAIKEIAALADARITVIAPDGKVVADSEHEPGGMENHASRPEVLAAARQGCGHAVRRSETLGTEMLYTAVRLDGAPGETPGFVRLSRPMERIRQVTSPFSRLVWTALPLVLLLGVLAFYYFIELRLTRGERSGAGDQLRHSMNDPE